MADKKYRLDIKLSDKTTKSVIFTVPQGDRGTDATVTTESIKTALGYTPANQEDVNSLSEKMAVLRNAAFAPYPQLPANGQKVGDPIGEGSAEPNFTNRLVPAECTLNKRISSDGSEKNATGHFYTGYIPATKDSIIRINLPKSAFDPDYGKLILYQGVAAEGYKYLSNTTPKSQYTINEEGDGVSSIAISSFSGSDFGLAMITAFRLQINLTGSVAVTAEDIADLIVTVDEPITYTEVAGDIATVAADFDGNNIGAQDIYAYMDKLVAKYPRLITKEVLGKDASGTYDWCRYVFGRRAYDAWMRPNYPPMYAWINGSTVIYSVSVSPRVGDTMYSTAYIGTAYSTVTAVDTPNQTRTVNGLVFSRDKTRDAEPTLVYTETPYSTSYIGTYDGLKNEVSKDVDGAKTRVGAITAMSGNMMSCNDGKTYIRYPLGDRDECFRGKPVILLGANEHGCSASNDGDTREPSIITARLAKDLCECDPRHAYLNMLRSNYKIVLVPVINPYGYTVGTYVNANNVNLDRNMDTPGWGNDSDTRHGAYGGSENETQYWMNTCVASKAIVGMANHSYGRAVSEETGEIISAGTCGCMIPRPVNAYAEHIERIEMVMNGYNLSLLFSDHAEPESYAKTRSYMDLVGIRSCALEMQASEGFILSRGGQMFTERVMEADYTLLLQFLNMLIECQQD